jgi:arsenate reductase
MALPHVQKESEMSEADYPDAMRVLFLCTHNSSRSQMAEGLLRPRGGDRYVVFSAGTHPRNVHPLAIQAMREMGIDINEAAGYRAKSLEEFIGQPPMDLVVTVCDEAAEECPFFPGARRQEHWGFPDPSAAMGTEAERLAAFRSVRDQIAARITTFVAQTS